MTMQTKRCPSCGQDLPHDAFRQVKSRPLGLSAYCRKCSRRKDAERYSDPEKRKQHLERQRRQYEQKREHKLSQAKQYRQGLRQAALIAYGGELPSCACCGESHQEFLEIDHVYGDGAAHRKKVGSSIQVLRWLRQNGYPPGFQVLCRNCNLAKWVYGACPHSQE